MTKLRTTLFILVALIVLACLFWEKTLQPTTTEIEDPVRHYFPIVQGDELSISCTIKNTGTEDLSITDIHPSNFSISRDTPMPGIIPAGKSEVMHFTFRSDKNIGYARHVIRFFGNIGSTGVDSLVFDVHIVRPTPDGSDYEEIYYDKVRSNVEDLIDGERGQKSYWTDDDTDEVDSTYIHSYTNELYINW